MKVIEPVTCKHDFVRRYAAGEFGNASPTWQSFLEWSSCSPWERFGHGQLYHIRNRIAGEETWYNLTAAILGRIWNTAAKKYGVGDLYISAMAPHHLNLLQGEVMEGPWGWSLYYAPGCKGLPMRDALAFNPLTLQGLQAKLLIRQAMNDLSFEWLEHLLATYDEHVVEFSVFSTCWGTVPGYNTVFWEVRRY